VCPLKHVKFEGPHRIVIEKCRKCKMCMRIGCPAIVDMGDHIEIMMLCVWVAGCVQKYVISMRLKRLVNNNEKV